MHVFSCMTYASTRSKRMLARVFVPTDVLRLSNSCDFDEMAKRHRRNDAFERIVSKGGVRARFKTKIYPPKSLQFDFSAMLESYWYI